MLDDGADRLCSRGASVPALCFEIRDDSGEKIEQLMRVLLLNVGELLGGSVADQLSAARLQEAVSRISIPPGCGVGQQKTYVTRRSSLLVEESAGVRTRKDVDSFDGKRTWRPWLARCLSGIVWVVIKERHDQELQSRHLWRTKLLKITRGLNHAGASNALHYCR